MPQMSADECPGDDASQRRYITFDLGLLSDFFTEPITTMMTVLTVCMQERWSCGRI